MTNCRLFCPQKSFQRSRTAFQSIPDSGEDWELCSDYDCWHKCNRMMVGTDWYAELKYCRCSDFVNKYTKFSAKKEYCYSKKTGSKWEEIAFWIPIFY